MVIGGVKIGWINICRSGGNSSVRHLQYMQAWYRESWSYSLVSFAGFPLKLHNLAPKSPVLPFICASSVDVLWLFSADNTEALISSQEHLLDHVGEHKLWCSDLFQEEMPRPCKVASIVLWNTVCANFLHLLVSFAEFPSLHISCPLKLTTNIRTKTEELHQSGAK
jgi:hypothetical protein